MIGAVLALLAGAGSMAETANAQLFVAYNDDRIGEYTLSGQAVNSSLIPGLPRPVGVAASGSNLWVSNGDSGTVGLYTTSGTPINPTLISGLSDPYGIAVSGSDLYVLSTFAGTIGKYNATTGAPEAVPLVSGLPVSYGITVSGSNLFVTTGSTISEHNASTGALVNSNLDPGLGGVGIAASGSFVFVTTFDGGVSKCTTSGAPVPGFAGVSGLIDPFGVAVFGSDLYVTDGGSLGRIGEYDANTGATINTNLVTWQTGLTQPLGIAAIPEPATLGILGIGVVTLLSRRRAAGR